MKIDGGRIINDFIEPTSVNMLSLSTSAIKNGLANSVSSSLKIL